MIVLLSLLACKDEPTPTEPVDTGDFSNTDCGMATDAYGVLVCLHRIGSLTEFESVATASDEDFALTETRFFSATDTAPLETFFANQQEFADGIAALRDGFPDTHGDLDASSYAGLTEGPGRSYSTGRLLVGEDDVWFTVEEGAEALSVDDVAAVWRDVRDRVDIAPPVFVPMGDQLERDWSEASFPVADFEEPPPPETYEPYVQGVGYGTIRLWSEAQFDVETAAGTWGASDVLVIGDAPFNIDRVAGGIVSAKRSPWLAPTNIRAAAFGVPSCFVPDALNVFALEEGLVRIECGAGEATITSATPADAQAHWDSITRDAGAVVVPDVLFATIALFDTVALETEVDRDLARSRYGEPSVGMAFAHQHLGLVKSQRGFAIPVLFYEDFLERNTFAAEIDGTVQIATFRDAIDAWLADPDFTADPEVRATRLLALSEAMKEGEVDSALVAALETSAVDVLGGTGITARFRSSGTAEHRLGLGGVGLDEAASGCIADDLDGNLIGPSVCDLDEVDERTAAAAIAEVYARLWSMDSVEARLHYGIGLEEVGSGVTVVERVVGESADIRAFTTDPLTGDSRFVVHAQIGERNAVDRDEDDLAEVVRVEMSGASVDSLTREQTSSELLPGEHVLTDAQLTDLAESLESLRSAYPADLAPAGTGEIQLDTRWKVLADGRLVLSEVRPYRVD